MKRSLVALVILLVCPILASAEVVFCGDATRVLWAHASIDPTRTPACPLTKTVLTKGVVTPQEIAAQITLINTVQVPYLKVVNNLLVEMTAQEKAVVDAPAIAAQQKFQEYQTKLAANNNCSAANLSNMETRIENIRDNIDTNLAAAANLAQLTAALRSMNSAYANLFKGTFECIELRRLLR